MTLSAVSAVEGRAIVTPPQVDRPWAQYELTVCVADADPANCRTLQCTANSDANGDTTCGIPGCEAVTTYTVVVVAIQGTTRSQSSSPGEFTTPEHGYVAARECMRQRLNCSVIILVYRKF